MWGTDFDVKNASASFSARCKTVVVLEQRRAGVSGFSPILRHLRRVGFSLFRSASQTTDDV